MGKQSELNSGQMDAAFAVSNFAGQESQKGASAIEYVMIIAVIVIAIAGAFVLFAPDIDGVFETMSGFLDGGDGGGG